ncbi:hypothetical protein [Solemya elarraichensis gill symbiont]|uniref:Uncharacterized protein n=1 Tax=Solemya elarraichensis gill symbiont TaxID=1918949 RepID=A0A1T2L0M5_9GAMM|nr:hypothetical protein [Solemya elarraichensis gill symbiont]OOZ38614.1 hypothetical protein BOW52_08285 [Solemya elarraichensis gill symbiont]
MGEVRQIDRAMRKLKRVKPKIYNAIEVKYTGDWKNEKLCAESLSVSTKELRCRVEVGKAFIEGVLLAHAA